MKKLMIGFWLVCIFAAIGLIPDPIGLWLKIIAVMTLLVHVIEFVLFEKTIKAKAAGNGDSGVKSFVMTMLFGLFYFKF